MKQDVKVRKRHAIVYGWTAEQDALLKRMKLDENRPWGEIYPHFPGRGQQAIRKRLAKLAGGAVGRQDLFSPEETALIFALRERDGLSWAEIDRRLDRGGCYYHYRDRKRRAEEQARLERGEPLEAVPAARVPVDVPEPASLTAALLGDPLPGRSALDQMRARQAQSTGGAPA